MIRLPKLLRSGVRSYYLQVIFYKRLAGHTYKYLQKLYNATLIWLVVSWLAIFFDTIFRCYPLDRTWSQDPSRACPASAATINYWITITCKHLLLTVTCLKLLTFIV